MYYDTCSIRNGARVYTRELLRESFRVKGRVTKRTVANITDWPAPVKAAIRQTLAANPDRRKGRKAARQGLPPDAVAAAGGAPAALAENLARCWGRPLTQGKSLGAVATVLGIARELGIERALGTDRQGRLALFQIIARVLDQGSRLSAVRAVGSHLGAELLGLDHFDENTLYANLDWLAEQQQAIEDRLFAARVACRDADGAADALFLYDVTSSYFEGVSNQLAAFGYNRDGKKGKKQVVAGLLTAADGQPLSIELFRGNTADPSTVAHQVAKLRTRFGGGEITLVGDRGMLKQPQQAELAAWGMRWLTALTKSQIEVLLRHEVLQLGLFDTQVAEVLDPVAGKRYLLRHNPLVAVHLADRRADQLATWQRQLQDENAYLAERPRATVAAALRRLTRRATRLKLSPWLSVTAEGRTLQEVSDEAARSEASKLDGCYVLHTDVPLAAADAATLDQRYHDLSQVEWAFRTMKTAHLELRPIYLRLEARTRAHALIVMLAYQIQRCLAARWQSFDLTIEEALRELGTLCTVQIALDHGAVLQEVPAPRAKLAALLAAARVELPRILPPAVWDVDTKVKLPKKRKTR